MQNATEAPPTNGRGGLREGAGRKPKALAAIAIDEATANGDAARAYQVLVTTMDDQAADPKLRIECAIEVLDRLAGRPR